MRRLILVILLPVVLVGCNSSTQPPPSNSGTKADDKQARSESEDSTDPLNPEDRRDPNLELVRQLMQKLNDESKAANEAQADYDFQTAANHWGVTVEILTRLYGSEAWQTRNARESKAAAEYQATFDSSQIADLKQLYEMQQQIALLIQQKNHEKAVAVSRNTSAATMRLFPNDSYMAGKQHLQLGRLEQMVGNFAVAIEHYRTAVLNLQKHVGELNPDIEGLHGFIAECLVAQNEMTRAIENYKTSARISRELWTEDSLEYAVRANDLGVCFHKMHDLDTASKVLKAAESIRRKKLGDRHPIVGHSLYNLGVVYNEMRKHDEAEKCLREALEMFKSSNKEMSPVVAECQNKLATTLMLLERPQDAEPLLSELVAFYESKGANDSGVATAKYRLGIALAKQRKYDLSEPLLIAALSLQESNMGPTDANTIRTKNALATLYSQTNRPEEAKRLASEVKSISYETRENAFGD